MSEIVEGTTRSSIRVISTISSFRNRATPFPSPWNIETSSVRQKENRGIQLLARKTTSMDEMQMNEIKKQFLNTVKAG